MTAGTTRFTTEHLAHVVHTGDDPPYERIQMLFAYATEFNTPLFYL